MPAIRPAPPTGTMTTSVAGASSRISSPTVPWPAITCGSSNGWTSTLPVFARCSSRRANAPAGSSASGSTRAPSARARSSLNGLAAAHEKTTQSSPSAAAPQASAIAWFPADAPATPRSRSEWSSAASRFTTPRTLNEPVCWRSSALSDSPGASADAVEQRRPSGPGRGSSRRPERRRRASLDRGSRRDPREELSGPDPRMRL